jgi:tRNA(Ile)-lysidine synthase
MSELHQAPVITCHHLDDAVEWWLFSSIHGTGKIIPCERPPFIRPFLLTRKETLKSWNIRKEVPWIEDPSNNKKEFMRNYIRHELVPRVLNVNPGIHKVVAKKIKDWHEKPI